MSDFSRGRRHLRPERAHSTGPRAALVLVLGLALTARADELVSTEPLLPIELGLRGGLVVSGYRYAGGGTAAPFAALVVAGRELFGPVALEGEVLATLAPIGSGPQSSGVLTVRAGVSFPRFSVTGGALVNLTGSPAPVQVLPSLTAALLVGPVVASLGVLDRASLAPARLSASWKGVGVGWVFPLGGEAFARVPLQPHLALDVHLLGLSLFNAFSLSALVGLVWLP
jgi:hypothetical protein